MLLAVAVKTPVRVEPVTAAVTVEPMPAWAWMVAPSPTLIVPASIPEVSAVVAVAAATPLVVVAAALTAAKPTPVMAPSLPTLIRSLAALWVSSWAVLIPTASPRVDTAVALPVVLVEVEETWSLSRLVPAVALIVAPSPKAMLPRTPAV